MIKKIILLISSFLLSSVHCSIDVKELTKTITPLMDAALSGDLELVKKHLATGKININAQDRQGRTALFIAAQENYPLIINELLKSKNIEVNKPDNDGLTPLAIAVENRHIGCVKALLAYCDKTKKIKQNLQLNLETRDYKLGLTPLMRAAHAGEEEIVKLLLEFGANPTATFIRNEKEQTISDIVPRDCQEILKLIDAKKEVYKERTKKILDQSHNQKQVSELISQGIDLTYVDRNEKPLLISISRHADDGLDNVKKLIAAGVDVNGKLPSDVGDETEKGNTALHLIARNKNNKHILPLLLNARANVNIKNDNGWTPLHFCAWSNTDFDITNQLLAAKADLNALDKTGRTPLHTVSNIKYKRPDLWDSSIAEREIKKITLVKLLLKHKVEVNAKDKKSMSPRQLAISQNNLEIAEILLNAKADLDLEYWWLGKDNYLHWAVKHEDRACVNHLLLKAKADVNSKEEMAQTPLHKATKQNSKIMQILIANQADANAKDIEGQTPLHLIGHRRSWMRKKALLLVNAKADVNAQDKDGQTCMHLRYRDNDVIKVLLDAAADVNIKDRQGMTALHKVANERYYIASPELEKEKKQRLKLLINAKADINAKDNNGQTPLFFSVKDNNTDIFEILVKAKADIFAKDNKYTSIDTQCGLIHYIYNDRESRTKSQERNAKITQMLLEARKEHDAKINEMYAKLKEVSPFQSKQNNGPATPDTSPLVQNNSQIIKLLLQKGAGTPQVNFILQTHARFS